ncbi:MAG TPA: GNAT family N-acetyltransferase [Terracidiphilus sp.]|nr:GNAT family N-acetyltransferase [Terracidiphilus sp.]
MSGHSAESLTVHIEQLSSASPAPSLVAAKTLLLEYGRFVIAQPGTARFCYGSLENEAERLPVGYEDQGGGCLLAWIVDEPAGFVAWRALPPNVARNAWEMKRLWVRSAARGTGLGRLLAQAVLDRAIAANCTAIYLDTVPEAMAAAHRMYLDLGFVPCPAYNDNPIEGIVYLVKHL